MMPVTAGAAPEPPARPAGNVARTPPRGSELAPPGEQWKVEAQAVDVAERAGVAGELARIPLALPFQERLGICALVAARLVVHDPALAELVAEQPVDHHAP